MNGGWKIINYPLRENFSFRANSLTCCLPKGHIFVCLMYMLHFKWVLQTIWPSINYITSHLLLRYGASDGLFRFTIFLWFSIYFFQALLYIWLNRLNAHTVLYCFVISIKKYICNANEKPCIKLNRIRSRKHKTFSIPYSYKPHHEFLAIICWSGLIFKIYMSLGCTQLRWDFEKNSTHKNNNMVLHRLT